jgi:hypothetical protein
MAKIDRPSMVRCRIDPGQHNRATSQAKGRGQRIERPVGVGAADHHHPPEVPHPRRKRGDLLLPDEGQHEAAEDRQRAQRHDQRGQAEPRDEEAVDRPQGPADRHAQHEQAPHHGTPGAKVFRIIAVGTW